jgi:hypothetical protein
LSEVPTTPIAPSEPVAAPPVAIEPAAPAAPVPVQPAAPAAEQSGAPVAPTVSSPDPAADTAGSLPAGAPDTPTAPAITPHTDTPGLLSTGEPKPTETPTETPAVQPAAPEPLKYEPLTLPEGTTLNAETLTKFDELLGTNQVAPELRQSLAEMHMAEAQRFQEHLQNEQHRIFAETRSEWRNQIMSDPDLGGSGFQTNLAAAQRMLQMFVPPERRVAMDKALVDTGMADHPEFFRLMVNLAKFYDEPASPPVAQKPPPDIGRRNGAGRRSDWYDHPRSNG